MTDRKTADALALAFATLHALIALASTSHPFFFGEVGRDALFLDVSIYFDYGSRVAQGGIPYRDFAVEYPPLAVPLFVAPRLVAASFDGYKVAFAVEMLAANAAMVWGLSRLLSRDHPPQVLAWRLAGYTVAFALLSPMTVARFDLAATAWAFAAAAAWSTRRPRLGAALAGSGTLLKVFPGVVALPALASGHRPARERAADLAVCAGVFASGALLWFWVGGRQVADSVRYHLDRGVEIGSIWSGALLWLSPRLGRPVGWGLNYNCVQVVSAWVGPAARLGFVAQVAALLAVAWRGRRVGLHGFVGLAGAAVVGFVTFGKVLSPQYLIWVLPFAACVEGRRGRAARVLYLGACVGTTLVFPHAWNGLLALRGREVGLLNLRNAFLFGLWAVLTFPAEPAPRRPGDVPAQGEV